MNKKPEELLDIYNEDWMHIGTSSRSEVHRLGLRHRTFHCWLIRRDGSDRYVRFQKRQSSKDTYPGCWDITAAGHLEAGESVMDAMREIEEELGIKPHSSELLPLGSHEERSTGIAGGVSFIDHELSEEFALVWGQPLLSHRLQREEVAGIYEARLDDMIALFEGQLHELQADGGEWADPEGLPSGSPGAPDSLSSAGLVPVVRAVRAADFVPRQAGYYARLFRRLLELA